MNHSFIFNGHTYRAYPIRYYKDGVEITPSEYSAAYEQSCRGNRH